MRITFLFLLPFSVYSQVWVKLDDFPGSKRDDGVAVVVNNKAYFGTGLQEWNATIDFRELDLNNYSWSTIPDMPHTTERQYACAFPGPNCFYVFGGSGVGGVLSNMYRYDIAQQTWSMAASKPSGGITGACSMSFGDKVIVCGGRFQGGITNDEVWEYTISTDTWTQKNTPAFGGRWRASAAVFNGKGYLTFGRDSLDAFHKEMFCYDPTNDSWTQVSDFPGSGRVYAAMHGGTHRIVVFGGQDTTGLYYGDTWFYTPPNTWEPGPTIPAAARRGGMSCINVNDLFYTCGLLAGDQRNTETWKFDAPVGIREENAENGFSVSPNPCSETLNLVFNLNAAPKTVTLYSICGNEIKRESIGEKSLLSLDVSMLPRGIYILQVEEGKSRSTKKIIKN